jgi:hypothetical protein
MGYQQEVHTAQAGMSQRASQLHWILLWERRYNDTAHSHIPCLKFVRDYFHYVSIVRAHSYRTFYQSLKGYPIGCPKVISATLFTSTWDQHDVKQPQNVRLVMFPCRNTLVKVPMKTISCELWSWMTLKFDIVCLRCYFSRIHESMAFHLPFTLKPQSLSDVTSISAACDTGCR